MRHLLVEGEMDPSWSPRARTVLTTMRAEHMFLREEALRYSEAAVRSRISKFQPCLPEMLLQELLVTGVLDVIGARRALGASHAARFSEQHEADSPPPPQQS